MTDTIAPSEAHPAPAPAPASAGVEAAASGLAARNRTALGLLLAAVFVVFLNETMMAVALPRIQESLHIDATKGQWLTTAFALTMAVVIPITGWLMQRLNTRPVFTVAMSSFVPSVHTATHVLVDGSTIVPGPHSVAATHAPLELSYVFPGPHR